MSLTTDQKPMPPGVPPWGIPATIAWVLFAFLISVVVAGGAFAAWQGDRANVRNFTYDGVLISIGALASIPVQIAVLAFAARLRHWPPADYLALNWPRRGEVVFAALCIVVLIVVFDVMMVVSGSERLLRIPNDTGAGPGRGGISVWRSPARPNYRATL